MVRLQEVTKVAEVEANGTGALIEIAARAATSAILLRLWDSCLSLSLSVCVCACVYVYIYIYVNK